VCVDLQSTIVARSDLCILEFSHAVVSFN